MVLFAESTDWIKARLRLSNVPDDAEDTIVIIDDSIERARLAFYRRLGIQRVEKLQTFVGSTVGSEHEILYSLAAQTEAKLVQAELLTRLPHAFMDGSGNIFKRWNEEAPVRERPRNERERELLTLKNDIEQDMQMLAGEDESLGEESEIHIYDGTPDFIPPLPGDSLFGGSRLRNFPED